MSSSSSFFFFLDFVFCVGRRSLFLWRLALAMESQWFSFSKKS